MGKYKINKKLIVLWTISICFFALAQYVSKLNFWDFTQVCILISIANALVRTDHGN
jgi:hypothetical protein